jgi:hypothetical protein
MLETNDTIPSGTEPNDINQTTIYIKQIGEIVQLGGQIATEEMLEQGWVLYSGNLPTRAPLPFEYLALVDGVIEIKKNEELAKKIQVNEMRQYLVDTDYKMTVDYFASMTPEQQQELIAKREEARGIIRKYLPTTPL